MAGFPPNIPTPPIPGAPPTAAPGIPPRPSMPGPPVTPDILKGMSPAMMIMFLAGAGFDKVVASMKKMQPGGTGLKHDAKNAPTQAMNPMLARIIAAQAAQRPMMSGGAGAPPTLPQIG